MSTALAFLAFAVCACAAIRIAYNADWPWRWFTDPQEELDASSRQLAEQDHARLQTVTFEQALVLLEEQERQALEEQRRQRLDACLESKLVPVRKHAVVQFGKERVH